MQNATFWDPGPPPGPSIVIPCGIVTHPQVGDVIDRRYLLVREIDRGGVGAVYEAEHRITQRSVALKLLSEHHRTSPESRARLLREARALTLARHRNVVAALDAGELDDGQPYLVMELMETACDWSCAVPCCNWCRIVFGTARSVSRSCMHGNWT